MALDRSLLVFREEGEKRAWKLTAKLRIDVQWGVMWGASPLAVAVLHVVTFVRHLPFRVVNPYSYGAFLGGVLLLALLSTFFFVRRLRFAIDGDTMTVRRGFPLRPFVAKLHAVGFELKVDGEGRNRIVTLVATDGERTITIGRDAREAKGLEKLHETLRTAVARARRAGPSSRQK